MTAEEIKKEIRKFGTKERGEVSKWFFKTGKGEYGEGDVFLGLTMGEQRNIAKKALLEISDQNFFSTVKNLLHSKEHEFRMVAVLILVLKYKSTDKKSISKKTAKKWSGKKESALTSNKLCQKIFDFYLKNTKWINNWDLVDVSASNIVGEYLRNQTFSKNKTSSKNQNSQRKINSLVKLAKSKSLWEKRIAMVSTLAFIKNGSSAEALAIAKILLSDKHDLIHKAVGWMLREVGKNCGEEVLIKFLHQNARKIPRTTLRYAIERFSKEERKIFLKM